MIENISRFFGQSLDFSERNAKFHGIMKLFELKSLSRSGNKLPDGSYRVYERELGIFDSVEHAEAFMNIIIEKEGGYYDFHCFFIFEKTLNRGLTGKFESVCNFEAVRSYLPDGTLFCDSPYDDACEKPFRGRPAETIKLNVGDLAWYWRWDRICPCLVTGLPFTDAAYREQVRKLGHEMRLDFCDDSYTVYTCDFGGHEHPEVWRCMPYYGKISKRNLQRIHTSRKREEELFESWRQSPAIPRSK